jgi:ammonia channel protein AmtB
MLQRIKLPSLLGAMALLAVAAPALAQDATPAADKGDTAWMLTSTALVLLMTIPGLALFYGGMVRKKNILATVMQSFAVTCLVTIIWMVVGYSLAFRTNPSEGLNAWIGGLDRFFLAGMGVGFGHDNMAPSNLVYSVIGASLLWVGWFGFNAGSELAADGRAGMAMTVTQIATAAAALAWMFTEWVIRGKPSILAAISGAVAGLVAITPASGWVDPTGGLIIGIVAGIVCAWAVMWLKAKLGYDDSLDAFGVHGVGGFVGAILTGVFAVSAVGGEGHSGLIDGNAGQVWVQFVGTLATIIWSGVATFVILKVVDAIVGLRVTKEVEIEGLDINLHGEVVP